MEEVVIVSAVRTAIGKLGGTLKDVLPEDLAEVVINESLNRAGIQGEQLDEVILGQAKQSADNPNIARLASLKANLPIEVPAYTVHRQCGSGLQSVINGAHQITLGLSQIVLAGGVESMSTAPYYIRNARYGALAGNTLLLDPNTESQPRSQPAEVYGELNMGMTAENLAEKYSISRQEQDEFALLSQERAHKAIFTGQLKEEIVPVPIPRRKKEPIYFKTDEHPREASLDELAKLKPVFKKNGTVTAGNASGRNDGASALVLMSKRKAQDLGINPIARFVSEGVAGVSPELMGIGPVTAIRLALSRAGLTIDDIDLIELNEAFAAQSLAVLKEIGIGTEKVNVNGGAIAFGHPIGNSGSRILVTLLHEMKRRQSRYGLATLCIAGGLGIAAIVENLQ
ncbi:thiolase family protein [Metabacillus arenae]|uniref:acetyl-CoA C-acetyltransferase n=1 Tax=Metabacillus arenae TaxID=2771434 RepID=A0A926NK93_9BACI|nr:acetyl-CoA C-acetyltransferase [Metabacillus arenae]MBD1382305.1 acetyl-CoA C-acetyltransferase [Metabacillus arenae]